MRARLAECCSSPRFQHRMFAPSHAFRPCGGMKRMSCGSENRSNLKKAFRDLLQTEEGQRFREMFSDYVSSRSMGAEDSIESAVPKKNSNVTRIAVPYENGMVRPSFGGVRKFKIYDVADQKVVAEKIIDNGEIVHADLVRFLASNETDIVICQNIGFNGYNFFLKNNIKIYVGAKGEADQAVQAFLDGTLDLSAEPSGCGNNCKNSDNTLG